MVFTNYIKNLKLKSNNIESSKYENKIIYASVFFISIAIQLVIFDFSSITINMDAYAYIDSTAWMRPHGYDLFLYISGLHFFKNFQSTIILQMIVISSVPVVLMVIFNLLKINKSISLIAISFWFLYLYPFTMSLQIMSESVYIFGCSILLLFFVRYILDPNNKSLLILLSLFFVVNEIRSTLLLIYPALLFAVFILYRNYKKNILIKHIFYIILCFLVHLNMGSLSIKFTPLTKGLESDRHLSIGFNKYINLDKNSGNIAPFFMFHYMVYSENINSKRQNNVPKNFTIPKKFIHPLNGDKSFQLFTLITDLYQKNQYLRNIISGELDFDGSLKNNNSENEKIKNLEVEDIKKIVFENTTKPNMWPLIIDNLYREYGFNRTGKILRGTLYESFIKYPEFFYNIYPKFLKYMFFNSFFHERIYSQFIAAKNTDFESYPKLLNFYPLSPNSYSSWVGRIDSLVGRDNYADNVPPYHSDIYFHTSIFKSYNNILKHKQKESSNALFKNFNKFAYPEFFFQSINQIFVFTIILIMPIMILTSLLNKYWFFSIPLAISGTLIILVTNLIFPAPRHICMNLIFLFPLVATGLSGVGLLIKNFQIKRGN